MMKSFRRMNIVLFSISCAVIFCEPNFCVPVLYAQTDIPGEAPFSLAPIFQDHMVLQQRTKVSFFGTGVPGTEVSLDGSWGKKSRTDVLADGTWHAALKTPKAGGPYEVAVRHGESVLVLHDVLVGEVWLCSGQSNMEMPLAGWPPSDTLRNSAYEIEHAAFPEIRLFHVQRRFSATPTTRLTGTWQACSPATVRSFSATAYFFGRKVYETLHVPVGLIEAAWGGTPVESWTSKETLGTFEEFTATLRAVEQYEACFPVLERWFGECPSLVVEDREPAHRWEGLHFQDDAYSAVDAADSTWDEMSLPGLWEKAAIGDFDGAVWFRKQIVLPSGWVGKSLVLHLGPIDDMDETYVNGELVGSTLGDGFWQTDRCYAVPGSVVRDRVLHIAVRVIDTQGGGGIWGDAGSLYVSCGDETVSLEGTWKYLPVAEYRAGVFSVFGGENHRFQDRPKMPIDFSAYSPTALFNGMIHPIVPFTIRGAIWYQGEANVDNPGLYERTFPAMIADWRRAFGIGDFPFYFVQIAPFQYGPTQSQYLREAQCRALRVINTGMAVTLDIADPVTIHPANKVDVGERLALWALAKTYGKKIMYSGPLYKSMKVARGKVILSFDYAGSGLVVKEIDGEHHVTIAGEDRVFRKAEVRVEGKQLIVSSPEIPEPVAVRYAWNNTARGTLFNREGLPASSFRTDDWEK